MGLILDSSVAIDRERSGVSAAELLTSIRAKAGPTQIALSVITVMELEHGIWRAQEPSRAEARQLFLDDLLAHIPIYPITPAVARRAGRIDAEQRKLGIQISVPDLLIGVPALELGYTVATANVRHFERIPGLDLLTL